MNDFVLVSISFSSESNQSPGKNNLFVFNSIQYFKTLSVSGTFLYTQNSPLTKAKGLFFKKTCIKPIYKSKRKRAKIKRPPKPNCCDLRDQINLPELWFSGIFLSG